MTAVIAILAIAAVAAAGTATALAIRNGGLSKDVAKRDARITLLLDARKRDAEALDLAVAESASVRSRMTAVNADLARELHALEERYAEIARVCRDPQVVTDHLGDVLAESEEKP